MSVKRKINHIVVIESLPDGDIMTGKELYEDVVKRHIDLLQEQSIKMTHVFFDAKTKNNFIESLKYVNTNSKYIPGGILIHIETHGSREKDGLVLADNSFISWKELVELLRPINIATCNKLYITMATCYGRFLYLGVEPSEKSPYQAYISASIAVKTSEIIEKFSLLFEILIQCGDLIFAYTELEKTKSNFFYMDSLRTFEEGIILLKRNLRSDPKYKENILDHPLLKDSLASGKVNNNQMDKIIEFVFKDIYIKHKKAFDFSDCD